MSSPTPDSAPSLLSARGRFEAARRLPRLPGSHREHGLHGHGFVLRAHVPVSALGSAPGREVQAMREHLARALDPLGYTDLNGLLEHPDDASLAAWLAERLRVGSAPAALELRSTPFQGVRSDAQGELLSLRRYRFQAAHFLPRVPAGHKCGRMHGHGFEVELCAAQVDHDTLDAHWAPLAARLDHVLLNDIEGLDNPTSEVLAAWIWERLRPSLDTLRSVAVFETGSSGARYDGRDYRIWKEFSLDSAVRVRRAPQGSAQARLHGQTFRLRLGLSAPLDRVLGWVVDFGDVKTLFRPLFERLDHQPLYEIDGLDDTDTPTLAHWILRACQPQLAAIDAVRLLEADGCGVVAGRAF
jgi:6-pyruvoyltetrahydropterin/6-carboxytetrahydropterin synthase